MSQFHTQVEYLMPITVDIGILPIVEALNKHPGIQTQSSCQGDPDGQFNKRASVQFTASRDGLFYIIGVLQEFPAMLDWELSVGSRGIFELSAVQGDVDMIAKALRGERKP